jgi:hypothetical protein
MDEDSPNLVALPKIPTDRGCCYVNLWAASQDPFQVSLRRRVARFVLVQNTKMG